MTSVLVYLLTYELSTVRTQTLKCENNKLIVQREKYINFVHLLFIILILNYGAMVTIVDKKANDEVCSGHLNML